MRWVLLCFLALLASCGQDESDNKEDKLATQKEAGKKDGQDLKKHPIYILNAMSLPECNADTEGRLYYVETQKSFRVCSNGNWKRVKLKGEKGEPGKDGKDGKDGEDGENGKDGKMPSSTVWVDPVTKDVWHAGPRDASSIFLNCSDPWREPTSNDLYGAYDNGIGVWVQNLPLTYTGIHSTDGDALVLEDSGADPSDLGTVKDYSNDNIGLFCVRPPEDA